MSLLENITFYINRCGLTIYYDNKYNNIFNQHRIAMIPKNMFYAKNKTVTLRNYS